MPHPFSPPEILNESHILQEFTSRDPELNKFLKEDALQAKAQGTAQTWVVTDRERPGHVAAFYSLAASSVRHDNATEEAKDGLPAFAIPVILLARLARDERFHGENLGPDLLQDALERSIMISRHAGVRAMLLHAKNEKLAAWYGSFGFLRPPQKTGPGRPITMMATLSKLSASIASQGD